MNEAEISAVATYLRGIGHTHANMLMDLQWRTDELIDEQSDPTHTQAQDVQQTLRLVASFNQQLGDTAQLAMREQLRLHMSRIDLAQVVRETIDLIGMRFARIPCSLTVLNEPAFVRGDRDRLLRSLYVIIENAHTYTSWSREDAGAVSVAIACRSEAVSIDIIDNGPGIDSAFLAQIGTPGMRGIPDIPGAGWSLFYVQGVVAAHGGTITFGDRADGLAGLCVSIHLPQERKTP